VASPFLWVTQLAEVVEFSKECLVP
jgi:hypothetical protein